ncbi:hypothetical protein ACFY0R_29130 [Streptomyces sp. NPDC001633]|uniref:hypothetical protein n=1 Tax=Streptomyces sp. NPDC001633 TaxID=3364595 RepID=UPI0036CCDFFC
MRRRTGPDDWRETHRARWDGRVAVHSASDFYDQERFRLVRGGLRDFETAGVGDVTGRSLLSLRCHFGQDTLSRAHRGAARELAAEFPPAGRQPRRRGRRMDRPRPLQP